MAIKSKNRRRLLLIVVVTILIPTFVMMGQYPKFYKETLAYQKINKEEFQKSEDFLKGFLRSCYVLYGREDESEDIRLLMEDFFPSFEDDFDNLIQFMDYQVQDGEGEVLDGYREGYAPERKMADEELEHYAFGVCLTFDRDGKLTVGKVTGSCLKEQKNTLRSLAANPENYLMGQYGEYAEGRASVMAPKDRVYYFAMTKENLESYLVEEYENSYQSESAPDVAVYLIVALIALVCFAALAYPHMQSLETGDEWIFRAPCELVVLVAMSGIGILGGNAGWIFTREAGNVNAADYVIWIAVFAAAYWTAGCARQIAVLGVRRYWRERTLLSPLGRAAAGGFHRMKNWCVRQADRLYRSLAHFDFQEKSNRVIGKIVLVNLAILVVICCFWFFGIAGLLVYSVLLFLVLQRYYNDLREKYAVLLKATGEIAEGNLDVEIEEDLGVFSPFRAEIQKIQSGFQKAVKEEVKSQRMKTELITNVSHDLKTPLTAIITYVSLLKDEKDEEKRQSYIGVLEQKSLRLKVLIEDLFEISKASSENVTLHPVDVDIVNLFKQVKLELEEKFEAAHLSFRMNLPEEKVILRLDSQKTYRIFENLLNNAAKYALENTRIYVDFTSGEEEVVIQIKNISASELTFNPEEITERFVRGDTARNTEGSGLGLAIVKSFVELQGGHFHVETEADLFKAQIRWKKS